MVIPLIEIFVLLYFRKEFYDIVRSLDKISRDSNQLLKGGSAPIVQQMQLQIGIWPTLADCMDGLKSISEMHRSE